MVDVTIYLNGRRHHLLIKYCVPLIRLRGHFLQVVCGGVIDLFRIGQTDRTIFE